jgi:hypothetical protein
MSTIEVEAYVVGRFRNILILFARLFPERLLFWFEPVMARDPSVLGGALSVITCLPTFQLMLLTGYGASAQSMGDVQGNRCSCGDDVPDFSVHRFTFDTTPINPGVIAATWLLWQLIKTVFIPRTTSYPLGFPSLKLAGQDRCDRCDFGS